MSGKIFISYRRDDSRYQARMIYEAFLRGMPRENVFMDVDTIPLGVNFVKVLEGWVEQCEVLLVLMGADWVNSTDPKTGKRRLDNPKDFVRVEIRSALTRDIPVVPVMLDGAEIPDEAQLPDDIKGLLSRNAEFVEYRTFDADVQRLLRKLGVGGSAQQTAAPAATAATQRPQAIEPSTRSSAENFEQGDLADKVQEKKPLAKEAKKWLAPVLGVAVASVFVFVWMGMKFEGYGTLEQVQQFEQSLKAAEAKVADAEKARQAAEAKAAEAIAAATKSEQARQAAEAQAADADKARQAVTAKAAEADKARQAAEAKAADAEKARQSTEAKAADADKARQAAEAKTATPVPSTTGFLAPATSSPFTPKRNMEAKPRLGYPVGSRSFLTTSAEDCEEGCTRAAEFNVWTYNKKTRWCVMYPVADLVPNDDYDSGIRR
jgi:hypothetical protein